MKSGGLKYHGQISDFVRNTSLTIGLLHPRQHVVTATGALAQAPKPIEHQNELSPASAHHAVYRKKLFFFVAYDNITIAARRRRPSITSHPAMLTGDFTELNGNVVRRPDGTVHQPAILYDPPQTVATEPEPSAPVTVPGHQGGVATNNVILRACSRPKQSHGGLCS